MEKKRQQRKGINKNREEKKDRDLKVMAPLKKMKKIRKKKKKKAKDKQKSQSEKCSSKSIQTPDSKTQESDWWNSFRQKNSTSGHFNISLFFCKKILTLDGFLFFFAEAIEIEVSAKKKPTFRIPSLFLTWSESVQSLSFYMGFWNASEFFVFWVSGVIS